MDRGGQSRSRTHRKRIYDEEFKLKIFGMRRDGYSYNEIAKDLGISKSVAYNFVSEVLADTASKCPENIEEVRKLELTRLDDLYNVYQKLSKIGDPKAAEIVIKTMYRRSKLLGLDAAMKHELSGPGGQSIEVINKYDLSKLSTEQLVQLKEIMGVLSESATDLEVQMKERDAKIQEKLKAKKEKKLLKKLDAK